MTDTVAPLTDAELRGEYDTALRRAGVKACDADRALYARTLVEVTNLYRGQEHGFARCIAEVERRCARATGFPDFDSWLSARALRAGGAA